MRILFSIIFSIVFCLAQAQDLSALYEKVLPSVVKIYTTENVNYPSLGYVATTGGLGSGVLIDEEGIILTASHVVQMANSIMVEFASGEQVPANVISSVPSADVALLKLVYKVKSPIAKLGDSDKMNVGNEIMMVGAPFGLDFSMSKGYISGRRILKKFANGSKFIEFFQTDAAINPGNSGGPMFNMDGEVIGVASYILSKSGGFEGLGFAATSNICQTLLLDTDPVWIGVEATFVSEELSTILNLPQKGAMLIQKVAPLSPADLMGLKGGFATLELGKTTIHVGGDIVLAVNGIEIKGEENYEALFNSINANDEIVLKIFRGGKTMNIVGKIKE
jgi:serine protease Do